MENELIDPENTEKLMAEEIQPISGVVSGISENDNDLEKDAAYSNNSPINSFLGKLAFSAKLLPFQSEEPILKTKIQKHQEWVLAKLKALCASEKSIQ
jgi:hypothetical protein